MEFKKLDSLLKKEQKTPSQTVLQEVCNLKKDERILIIANPDTAEISQDIYTTATQMGARATLIFQPNKTSFDNANPEVLAAIKTNPDVCFSVSAIKLGKDPEASQNPYTTEDGQKFSHIFDYLLDGKKTMRAVWTPGITTDMMNRTACIDYKELSDRCKKLTDIFVGAVKILVTAPGGTNLTIPVENRALLSDDGNFTKPGTGGNIPAGEVFISPVVGNGTDTGCQGMIVYDGSMTFNDGDSILETPISCKVENGYVTEISGGSEAKRLLNTITQAESKAIAMEKEGKLPSGMGQIYKKNARNIGELGIGLNPAAKITGNMLEDEKAFHTCHFAIGENYDNDAPSLIHLDGVVREPTITLFFNDGSSKTILNNGKLTLE